MAKLILLGDDLALAEDGAQVPASTTVLLAYQVQGSPGRQVELDLTEAHEKELAELLARYFAAGQPPESPLALRRVPTQRHRPGGSGRAMTPEHRRLAAYARRQGIDIFRKPSGEPYSGGKPYFGAGLKGDYAAFMATPEATAWLAGLSEADGGEAP